MLFDDAISLLSILWDSMSTCLTPTVLFLLLNLMIATIALTSGFKPHRHNHHDSAVNHHPPPPPLTRSPSVLQRLKSINFYSYYSHTPSSTTTLVHQPASDPSIDPNVPVRVPDEDTLDEDGPTLDEIYSRIKGSSSSLHYTRQKSDTNPTGGDIPVKLPAKIKKSASDKSAFNHFQPVEEPENLAPPLVEESKVAATAAQGGCEVDARADDFINRFKKQLQLQKMESIVRYKEMITRGSEQQ